jgi:tetrahydromethanopterin S-methyltransferase subunit G
MPHIVIDAGNYNLQIKRIYIHAEVEFKSESFKSAKMKLRLDQIKAALENVLLEYFDSVDGEIYSNHEWNEETE